MESNMFNYDEVKVSDTFGLKRYNDAIYRGHIIDGKR